MKKKICILLIPIMIVLGVCIMFFNKKEEPVNTEPYVHYFSYSSSGGMLGGKEEIILENGKITRSYKESYDAKEIKSNGNASEALLKQIDTLAKENNMESWTNLKNSDLIANDAPTSYITIRFNNSKLIQFYSYQELPGDGWYKINEIISLLTDATK